MHVMRMEINDKLFRNPVKNEKDESDNRATTVPNVPNTYKDHASKIGQFGWYEISKTFIPYLIRMDEKFVSRRMAQAKILNGIRDIFSNDLLHCVQIKLYGASLSEAKLLNEINIYHSDYVYGKHAFLEGDPLILLNDVIELVEFISFCCDVLTADKKAGKRRCGFVSINAQDHVCYIWVKNKQYVPLFYFEGESRYLEERAVRLGHWDVAYIKFACKVQGIRNEFFDKSNLKFVELNFIKEFFLPDTPFVESWPSENKLNYLVTQKPPRKQVNQIPPTVTNHGQWLHAYSLNRQDNNDSRCVPNVHRNITDVTYVQNIRPTQNVYHSPQINHHQHSTTHSSSSASLPPPYRPPRNIGNNFTPLQFPIISMYDLQRAVLMDDFVMTNCLNNQKIEVACIMVSLERVAISYFKRDPVVFTNAIIQLEMRVFQPTQIQAELLNSRGISGSFGMLRLLDIRHKLESLRHML